MLNTHPMLNIESMLNIRAMFNIESMFCITRPGRPARFFAGRGEARIPDFRNCLKTP
jgi:hypothetical protein